MLRGENFSEERRNGFVTWLEELAARQAKANPKMDCNDPIGCHSERLTRQLSEPGRNPGDDEDEEERTNHGQHSPYFTIFFSGMQSEP